MPETDKILSKDDALEALDHCEILDEANRSSIKNLVKQDWIIVERDLKNPKNLILKLTEEKLEMLTRKFQASL